MVGRTLTAQQSHQAMVYLILEMFNRTLQLPRLLMPRAVVLAGIHGPEEPAAGFCLNIFPFPHFFRRGNHSIECGLEYVAENKMWKVLFVCVVFAGSFEHLLRKFVMSVRHFVLVAKISNLGVYTGQVLILNNINRKK